MQTLLLDIPQEQRPFAGPEVLVYYDGPQLFWLPVPGRRLLALSLVPVEGRCPYVVVELTQEVAEALEGNRMTLKAAFEAATSSWLMPDYGAAALELQPLAGIPEQWLPGAVLLRLETL